MTEKRVKLKSSDDELFEVEEAVADKSQIVKNAIEDTGTDRPIPLPKKSTEDKPATPEDEVKSWDQDFVKVDQATLFDLIMGEHTTSMPLLRDVSCRHVNLIHTLCLLLQDIML
ncbi:unnamed protein product [Sphagnum compactum]